MNLKEENRKVVFMLLAMVMLANINVSAQHVTEEQAIMKAQDFLNKKAVTVSGRNKSPRKLRQLEMVVQNDAYYIFNAEQDGGFVIVSGDERTEEILGYSTEGNLDISHMPENVKVWLNGYEEQIKSVPANANVASAKVSTHPAVEPLMKSLWNQEYPYNMECPIIDDVRSPTGCGAVALAQVMYYYKWPHDYTQIIPSYSSIKRTYDELPPVQFDWDNMLDTYSDEATDKQKKAVADLMLYCGYAAETWYNASNSSADAADFPMALMRLGYAKTIKWRERIYYPADKWENMIYNELSEGRPVICSARHYYQGRGGGHSFVCDGYDGMGMFHINWGWNGRANGYYRLQALNPWHEVGYSLDYGGYSVRQCAIIGISPTEISTLFDMSNVMVGSFNLSSDLEKEYDSNVGLDDVSVDYSFGYNANYDRNKDGGYDVGIGLFDGNRLIDAMMLCEAFDATWRYPSDYNLSGLGKNLTHGTYALKGIARKHGSSQWMPNIDADMYWVSIELKDGILTGQNRYTPPTSHQVLSVKQFFDDEFPDMRQLRINVRNKGASDSSPLLYLYVDGVEMNCEQAYLTSEQTDYIDFVFKSEVGKHKIEIIAEVSIFNKGHTIDTLYVSEDFHIYDTAADVNQYTLTYIVDGETYKICEVEFGTNIIAAEEPEKKGYTFSGWSEIPATMPANDVTVTGSFTINKYKLIYTVDGETHKICEVEYGTNITAEDAPEKEGYTFSGWSEIPATMPANDVTVTGSFTLTDGIRNMKANDGDAQIYTPTGQAVNTLQPGVNIIRYSNGQVKKVQGR